MYFGDEGARILAEFLKNVNQQVVLLELRGNNIGTFGYKTIFILLYFFK